MTTLKRNGLVLNAASENDNPLGNLKGIKNAPSIATRRAALGNIANAPLTRSQASNGPVKKESGPGLKPSRTLTKQKATVSLQNPQQKQKAHTMTRRSASKKDEEPMDIVMEDKNEDVEMESVTSYSSAMSGGPAPVTHLKDTETLNHEDIDKEDTENPQLVVTYVNDIYGYLRYLEKEQSIKKSYLSAFPERKNSIVPKMRNVLVDWLVDVHQQFNLLQETLYLTVAIIDRYLQVEGGSVERKKLQLVGVTAMFIASKYEEMYAPEIGDFVYITDNAYNKKEIRVMEMRIMETLAFEFGRPLPLHFLRRNSKAGFVDARMHTLAKYVMELSIIDYYMSHIPPSMLAAAALAFSLRILDEDPENKGNTSEYWTGTLEHYSAYKWEDISSLVMELAKMTLKTTRAPADAKLMAVRKKYSDSKMYKIAKIPQLKSEVAIALSEGRF